MYISLLVSISFAVFSAGKNSFTKSSINYYSKLAQRIYS